ncbi:MAG: nuclear transport factor 2 family protein [Austwickia sp.]|nr:nuclear transport factor 2 family protein [Austwickia sp.]MBK9100321.1 nuclear transport factor 2 family protein [Austwickia sp.]
MSTEPRDLRAAVQGYYDALDADDIEAVLSSFSGDVLYRRPGYADMVGLHQLRDYYSSAERKIAPGRHVLRRILVDHLSAAAHGVYEGQLKDGGAPATVGFAAFFTFDGSGRISEHQTYFFVPAV